MGYHHQVLFCQCPEVAGWPLGKRILSMVLSCNHQGSYVNQIRSEAGTSGLGHAVENLGLSTCVFLISSGFEGSVLITG